MHRTVGDFILDLADNALEAGADVVNVAVDETPHSIRVVIGDNGCGMSAELLARVRDPYCTAGVKHPGRRVGLGIPFLVQTVELCGGECSIDSEPGKGTTVSFELPADHIDRPPLGEMSDYLAALMLKSGDYECIIRRRRSGDGNEAGYTVSRSELIDALGEIESVSSQQLVRRFMASHEEEIQ